MDLGLEGRVCVVTGASRGIGAATARALCSAGARVLLVSRDRRALDETAAACGAAETLTVDVTDTDAGERVAAACTERLGPVEVLVNCAGTSAVRTLDELTDGDWRAQWELNVMAPLRLIRAVAPGMTERGRGAIVNVCSAAGKHPARSNAAYSVTKAAELALSRACADAYAASGVRVNAVAPGRVESPLRMAPGGLADQAAERDGTSREQALAAMRAEIPLGRLATEDGVASAIAFLCSDRASNVTGAAWSVDGGLVQAIV